MSFHLRRYQSSDFETLFALDRQCYPRGIAYSRSTLRSFLEPPESECLVADLAGEANPPGNERGGPRVTGAADARIVGFIVGEMESETSDRAERKAAHVVTLDVAPDRRREGIGSALLHALERRLAGRGARRVELETATDNEVAIAFWQRHGYRAVGVIERYYLNRIDALSMTKSLLESP